MNAARRLLIRRGMSPDVDELLEVFALALELVTSVAEILSPPALAAEREALRLAATRLAKALAEAAYTAGPERQTVLEDARRAVLDSVAALRRLRLRGGVDAVTHVRLRLLCERIYGALTRAIH